MPGTGNTRESAIQASQGPNQLNPYSAHRCLQISSSSPPPAGTSRQRIACYWDLSAAAASTCHCIFSTFHMQCSAVALLGALLWTRQAIDCHNLERYREHGMPWLPQVMKRIPGKTEKHTRNKVLVLVSSVGLIMNKDFVSYEKLKDLLLELKMTQAELQKYRILSTSVCEKVFGFTLYKLHYDILYRMGNPKPHTEKKLPPDLPLEMEEEDAPVLEEDEEPDLLQTRAVYMPAHTSRHWTQQEEGFINLDPTISTGVAYKEYVGQCKAARLPARSYKGFGRKRRDLLRNE
ncbi:uncharacterized protein LOC109203832 [Oreochromis niloticus]|uniref:uncharacterized protein LOC109200351 n=2 Tax=Oreochromis niloticus TaxID=8128 RepID=UPI00090560EE|nr:uncharacterized protein LOC109200351 [Oreochromis niloticus]XP_019211433.1 uncharacterized protein LOC109200351 [Oreochromis niloticus]XP_019211435.1 uncharacterized protein LOC109200352 [Oreochromis niloticus]XP_019219152.1 uncharacterized protein LOC109203832 [Oreochromis niloticus]XP_019219153.1 uncharacterized protein LOC109203832 [Oreochromis niloticus]